jgi:hypothetical protein
MKIDEIKISKITRFDCGNVCIEADKEKCCLKIIRSDWAFYGKEVSGLKELVEKAYDIIFEDRRLV